MDLEQAQTELREKSKEDRRKRSVRNGSSPKKEKVLRARVSERTLLVWLAQDTSATGQARLDAIKLLLQIGGKLPAEEPKNDPIAPPAPVRGSDLAPARPV